MNTHFGKTLTILSTILLVSATLAQASSHRPNTTHMSCAQARSLVHSRGAVILSTGRFTYNKYVKNHAYCNVSEELIRAHVPTIDSHRCNVGFICKERVPRN